MPYYTPIGEIFADLHDRPERMLAKGVIRSIVNWRGARTYFYWRIKRRVRAPPVRAQAAPPVPPRPIRLTAAAHARRPRGEAHARASTCQVREEELVASLTAAVGTMTHAEALAKLHSSMPADALADDKKAYEMLQKMVIEVQK